MAETIEEARALFDALIIEADQVMAEIRAEELERIERMASRIYHRAKKLRMSTALRAADISMDARRRLEEQDEKAANQLVTDMEWMATTSRVALRGARRRMLP